MYILTWCLCLIAHLSLIGRGREAQSTDERRTTLCSNRKKTTLILDERRTTLCSTRKKINASMVAPRGDWCLRTMLAELPLWPSPIACSSPSSYQMLTDIFLNRIAKRATRKGWRTRRKTRKRETRRRRRKSRKHLLLHVSYVLLLLFLLPLSCSSSFFRPFGIREGELHI